MTFTKMEASYNIYGEFNGHKCTCIVCGYTWHKSTRNDDILGGCKHVALIKEWDDEHSIVHFEDFGNEVQIRYQDCVAHIVTKAYFNSVLLHVF